MRAFLAAAMLAVLLLASGAQSQPALGLMGQDVRAHGATGNGESDDTRALQDALEAASWRGGKVLLPAGVYRTSRPIGNFARATYVGRLAEPLDARGDSLVVVPRDGQELFDSAGGLLLIRDDQTSSNEIMRYSQAVKGRLSGLVRGQEGTRAHAFKMGRRVYALAQPLGALEQALDERSTALTLRDARAFPAEGGWIVVGLEVMRYARREGNTLLGLTRGRKSAIREPGGHSDAQAAPHAAGSGVWKFPQAIALEGEPGTVLRYEGKGAAIAFHAEDWPCMAYGGGLRNLRIEGHPAEKGSTTGIDVLNHHRLLIERVEVSGFTTGIRFGERAWSNRAVGCHVEACETSYKIGLSANSTVLDTCSSLYAKAYSLDSDGATQLVIRNSAFEFGGPLRLRGHAITLDGCRFDTITTPPGKPRGALQVTGNPGDAFFRDSVGVTVSNSYFTLDLQSAYAVEAERVRQLSLSHNVFNGARDHAVRLGPESSDTRLQANRHVGPDDPLYRAKSANGVLDLSQGTLRLNAPLTR